MKHAIKLAVIGGGNMGGALVSGLIEAGVYRAPEILVVERSAAQRRAWSRRKTPTTADVTVARNATDAVVLAVKPQQMKEVLLALGAPKSLVISVAAGVPTGVIERFTGKTPVIRVMPNTPALVRAGALVYCRGRYARPVDEKRARKILSALGPVWRVAEKDMDAVTALSGSGPAYVFYLAEIMAEAGRSLGLNGVLAEQLARQTVFGAGRLLAESAASPATLRERVTSPGGTTQAALATIEAGGARTLFRRALAAAKSRSQELCAITNQG